MQQGLKLSEYNNLLKRLVAASGALQGQWVIAETSDLRVSRGHCYLELIEKNAGGATVARIGAVIWASTFEWLNSKFLQATSSSLASGMKVMVRVNANFHEQYGLKVVITDIEPEYTMGDMARIRREIIERLTREGIIDMNRELAWGVFPQRIAVISAQGAAGYGDFINQLHNNSYGLKFYTCLFQAVMQGVNTVPSVINALDRINAVEEYFDCVVIIRGGGSTSDLNSFDNYELGANIAQFPLPVITGIGHDRDITIPDMVSKLHVKTPTAAAEFLIHCGVAQLERISTLATDVVANVRDIIKQAETQLSYYGNFIPLAARKLIDTNTTKLLSITHSVPIILTGRINGENTRLRHNMAMIDSAVAAGVERERQRLRALDDKVRLLSPRNIIDRGYSLTMCNGHVVTGTSAVKPGDEVVTLLKDGSIKSVVKDLS